MARHKKCRSRKGGAGARLRKAWERRPPVKFRDYEDNRKSTSPSSNNMSDTEENSEQEQALLDRTTTWQRVRAQMTDENGASVCDWTNHKNDSVIKKYFKVRRKWLSLDELLCEYFLRGDDSLYKEWMASTDVQNLLSFLRKTTSVVDTKESHLFFRRSDNVSQRQLSSTIQTVVLDSAMFQEAKTSHLDRVIKPLYRAIAVKMWAGVPDWLSYLGHVIKKNPANTVESAFEELTRIFLTTCGLLCVDGDSEQFALPDMDKKCHPDLIFAAQHSTSPYWGTVEAKRMSKDPTFKHFFHVPPKGIMKKTVKDPPASKTNLKKNLKKKRHVTYHKEDPADLPSDVKDKCIPSKKRCVTYCEEDEVDDPDSKGLVLPECVRKTVDIFFSQLFGQIISLDCCQPSYKNRRMGIGVVGFRVFFLAFYAKPGGPFAKIPETQGAKTEVHIAGPLCILDAEDREDIARILLLLAAGQKW